MSNIVIAQATKLATTLGMSGEGGDLIQTLKATAFKGQVSDAQMGALLIVANQYGLNPWTKEIYAFPDKNNSIVPVVGVDGWARIINSHAQFDGMDFEQDNESCTCIIYRKDRGHPIKVTEYMSECKRSVGPWLSHPKRMLRHKAMIQASRIAFGFVGVYDQDEAERISETLNDLDSETGEVIVFDAISACAEISQSCTLDGLQTLWKQYGAEAIAAKDKGAHAMLKNAVLERKAQLEAHITDVEPKE